MLRQAGCGFLLSSNTNFPAPTVRRGPRGLSTTVLAGQNDEDLARVLLHYRRRRETAEDGEVRSMVAADLETWIRAISFAPIFVSSVIGFGLALWKWRQLRQPDMPPGAALGRLCDMLRAGDLEGARALTRADPSRTARLIRPLLGLAGHATTKLAARAEQTGAQLARELEYGLGALGLIATLGPLFGLLGTVIGITVVFNRLASTGGLANPQMLAGGIGTALHTTIAGLLVGVLALISHRYLAAQVDRLVGTLETVAAEVVDLCGEEYGG